MILGCFDITCRCLLSQDVIYLRPVVVPSAGTTMSIIQDKLGNEFLRSNGSMDSGFGPGMIMFSHLPPVTSFTRLAAHSVVQDLPPADVILKKERDSPDCSIDAQGGRMGCASMGNYVHTMGIKQENLSEQDSCLLVYPGATGKTAGLLGGPASNNQNLLMHDLNLGQVSRSGAVLYFGVWTLFGGLDRLFDC